MPRIVGMLSTSYRTPTMVRTHTRVIEEAPARFSLILHCTWYIHLREQMTMLLVKNQPPTLKVV